MTTKYEKTLHAEIARLRVERDELRERLGLNYYYTHARGMDNSLYESRMDDQERKICPDTINALEDDLAHYEGATKKFLDDMNNAVMIAWEYGGVDGVHHKAWVIDQMVRALTGSRYEEFVELACEGEDGPETYEWDCGIEP